jgi:hypothetical protein
MAVEEIIYTKDYIGTAAEMAAMVKKGVVPGSTFWVYDTKAGYVFADGDWRAIT